MKTRLKRFWAKFDATDISGIKNVLLKPLNMVLSLVYTPLLLSYLGNESYGLWSTILTVINWINYFDLGVGLGLRNLLTKELTAKQYDDAKKTVSTAYIILTAISLPMLLVLIILAFSLNWFDLFNTTIDVRTPLLITFVFICINFVLALCNQLLYALQLSERVAFRSTIVQLLNLVGVFVLSKTAQPNLIYMAILFGATSSIIHVFNMVGIFSKHRYLCPNVKLFDKKKIPQITNVGFAFFAIQLSCLLLYSADHILITHYLGPEEIPPVDVANKIFGLGCTFLAALMVPYLSRTTEALEKGNFNWIRRAIKKMYTLYAIVVVAYIFLAIFFREFVGIYMMIGGKNVELTFSNGLIVTMFLHYLFYSFVTINTPFINGTGKLTFQMIVSLASGILCIPLAIFLGVTCGLGVVGIKLATVIMLAIGAVVYPFNLHNILKREEKKYKEKLSLESECAENSSINDK